MTPRPPGSLQNKSLLPVWLVLTLLTVSLTSNGRAEVITNLQQLSAAVRNHQQLTCDVDLTVTVCAASRPKVGVLIAQDGTGVELLQMGGFDREILPGEQVRIRGDACLLRKREMGVEISASPLLNNDGLHGRAPMSAEVALRAGRIPLQVDWFNYWRSFALDVEWAKTNEPVQLIEAARFSHAVVTGTGATNFLPGLRFECYEGTWESLPDFSLLKAVNTGVTTNLSLSVRPRDESVGIRHTGHLDIPQDGRYRFRIWSDDGAMLFLGDPRVPVVSVGRTNAPQAGAMRLPGAGISNLDERRWAVAAGRVSFVARTGEGIQLDLGTAPYAIAVKIADADGLNLSDLLNARVRVRGITRGVLADGQTPVFGRLFAAGARDLVLVESALGQGDPVLPLKSVAQVQSLSIERARQSLPVRLRGTVTGAVNTSQEHWMTLQDDTRGVFVRLPALTNPAPAFGEMWEVEGRSGAGDFAPIVFAEQLTRLGEGLLPAPVKPTWADLLNGNKDVQWAELQGLVAGVQSNTITLHLPEGRLEVELDGRFESDLVPFLKSVVKIRGVLYAVWDAATREVRVGRVMMRSSTIGVDVPAPADPFEAVLRTPRELLLFDAQASAFRPVKVRGQIVYADATQLYLEEGGTGLRLLPVEKITVLPGDVVEAVGYPDIGRTQLLMREVLLRKTGAAPLPPARKLDESALAQKEVNSTRVRLQGRLLGWHAEAGTPVLEMQFGDRLSLARISRAESGPLSLRPGSLLALDGVLVGDDFPPSPNASHRAFELLLNSMADITVLSQPSWWTLPRLLVLVCVLLVILVFTVIWNTQLRRLVEQRTSQLQHETRERERVERRHALEAERSRIARDLHDDLGSSLTEISVLASTGQLPQADAGSQPGLFQAIGGKARSLISALDVIVWAVDPEDNSLQSLADYLSGYTAEFFSHTPVECRFKVPMSFPPITLEGRVRHELLMAVKEALNNIVRHAAATEVEFRMAMADDHLEIDIADNGKGIKETTQGGGHGLKNLSARLQKLGGDCALASPAEGGTIVKIRLSLAAFASAEPDRPRKA